MLSQRTILLIDDEKPMRMKLKKPLKAAGFKVIEASGALDATNCLMRAKNSIDLILLDINIPEVDGRGISDIIDEYAPELPIIVTSVHPVGDQNLRIPRAVDYYSKLNNVDSLIKKVKNALGVEGKVA